MRHLGDPLSRRVARPLGWYLPRGGYSAKVLGYNPIAYWPLNETAGATAACLVNSAQNGTYMGVTLANVVGPDGTNYAPLFDGVNDFVNIYSATLAGIFNGAEGSAMIWSRVFNAGVWTDGTVRYAGRWAVNASNQVLIYRIATNNRLRYQYNAGGTNKLINHDSTSTSWMNFIITWSKSSGVDGEVKAYFNGSQTGATQTALGVWAGALNLSTVIIGAASTIPASPWYGYLAHVAVWDRPLTATQIADLATV